MPVLDERDAAPIVRAWPFAPLLKEGRETSVEQQKRRQARVPTSRARSRANDIGVLEGVQRDLQRRLDVLEERIDEVQFEARKRVARLLRGLERVVAPAPKARAPGRATSKVRETDAPRATAGEEGR
jgi:hypothetical protein